MKLIVTLIGRKPVCHLLGETNDAVKFADGIQELVAANKTLKIEVNGHSVIYLTSQIQKIEVRP